MPSEKPPRPSIRPFIADEMSTSRGKRLLLQRALGTAAPQLGAPEVRKSALMEKLAALTTAGARAELSRFLLAQSRQLEAEVKGGDHHAANTLLRAYEHVALDAPHAEQAIGWAGRLGKDRELYRTLELGVGAGLRDRVLTKVVGPAIPLALQTFESRFFGQRTAPAKLSSALTRLFRDFDAKSAFAEVAKLKPNLPRK